MTFRYHILCNYILTLHHVCIRKLSALGQFGSYVLFGVNFRSLQKIEAIMGGVGGYLTMGPFRETTVYDSSYQHQIVTLPSHM